MQADRQTDSLAEGQSVEPLRKTKTRRYIPATGIPLNESRCLSKIHDSPKHYCRKGSTKASQSKPITDRY